MVAKSLVGRMLDAFKSLGNSKPLETEEIIIPVVESKEIESNKFRSPEPEIGETWFLKTDNPFEDDIYVEIVDKKEGYVKYLIAGFNSSLRLDDFMRTYKKAN